MNRTKKNNVMFPHKLAIRYSDDEQKIIDKVRTGFKLSSDAEAIRFILNFWWKSLGSDAVDVKKLAQLLNGDEENGTPQPTES
ncbi:MAG: hypothetical protein GWP10_20485 [Nitrospiraceae bacterium]|nr:hypothetical protein [Nitrospiraceae bacterium]